MKICTFKVGTGSAEENLKSGYCMGGFVNHAKVAYYSDGIISPTFIFQKSLLTLTLRYSL